jgi:hypothetical protein
MLLLIEPHYQHLLRCQLLLVLVLLLLRLTWHACVMQEAAHPGL